MRKLILSLMALLPMLGFAQNGQIDLMQVIPNDPAVRTGVLDCGIKYYIRHNAKDPKRANFHIMYNVGAIQEEDNQNGLAHFLEHMAFNGSKNFPGNQMIDYLKSIGVSFGENLNAWTSQENTTYMIQNVPVTRETVIDSVMLVLHDWAGFISLNDADIDEERGVILEEIRTRTNARQRIQDAHFPVMFANSKYAKRNVLGPSELISSFSYDDIRSFYHKWYRPDLQAFVIVGDIDVDQIEQKLIKLMADVEPRNDANPKVPVKIGDNDTPLVAVAVDPELTSTDVKIIYRHEPLPEQFNNTVLKQKLGVINYAVAMMLNERFADISSKENAPFIGAYGYYTNLTNTSDAFYAGVNSKSNDSAEAFRALLTEIYRMQRGGFVSSEYERAKIKILSHQENAYNNRNDRRNGQLVQECIDNFTSNYPIIEPDYDLELTKQLLETTTVEEINQMAQAMIRDKNISILLSAPSNTKYPTEKELLAIYNEVKDSEIEIFREDVKTEPLVDAAAIKGGKVVKVEKGQWESTIWTLNNGVRVIVKPTTFKADEVIMRGSQMGGTSLIEDLEDLRSISFYPLLASNAGLGNFSKTELSKVLAGKIASANVGVGEREVVLSGRSSVKDIETMLQLAYLRYTAPRFEQSELNVTLDQIRPYLEHMEKTPQFVMQKELILALGGGSPRVALNVMGEADLHKVSLERMEKIYREQFSNVNGMTLVISGNVDLAALKPLVEKYIGALPSKAEKGAYGTFTDQPVTGKLIREFRVDMETPKVTNYIIYSGNMEWTLRDKILFDAISNILDTRYTKAIREEAGGTYGVQVMTQKSLMPTPRFTTFVVFDTDEAKIDELVPIVHKEINDLMIAPPTQENLTMYKEYAPKKFEEVNQQNGTWISYLIDYYVWNTDNYTGYTDIVKSITVEDVQAAAKKAYSQENLIQVVMRPTKK